MRRYIMIVDGCRQRYINATSHEMAYRRECNWHSCKSTAFIIDVETGLTKSFRKYATDTAGIYDISEIDLSETA